MARSRNPVSQDSLKDLTRQTLVAKLVDTDTKLVAKTTTNADNSRGRKAAKACLTEKKAKIKTQNHEIRIAKSQGLTFLEDANVDRYSKLSFLRAGFLHANRSRGADHDDLLMKVWESAQAIAPIHHADIQFICHEYHSTADVYNWFPALDPNPPVAPAPVVNAPQAAAPPADDSASSDSDSSSDSESSDSDSSSSDSDSSFDEEQDA